MTLTRKPLSDALRADLEAWTAGYQDQLDENPDVIEWLEGHRGLGWPTISRFRLGYVDTPLLPDHDYLRGRVVIPNICQAGHVVGLKFGSMDPQVEKKFKYLYLRGGETRLWNLQALNYCRGRIFVTEGEFKAMALEDAGIPAIGVPGANVMGPQPVVDEKTGKTTKPKNQVKYRRRIFDDLEVILVRDSDAGGEALVQTMDWVNRVVNPKPYKGVDDLRKAEGDEAMFRLLSGR